MCHANRVSLQGTKSERDASSINAAGKVAAQNLGLQIADIMAKNAITKDLFTLRYYGTARAIESAKEVSNQLGLEVTGVVHVALRGQKYDAYKKSSVVPN